MKTNTLAPWRLEGSSLVTGQKTVRLRLAHHIHSRTQPGASRLVAMFAFAAMVATGLAGANDDLAATLTARKVAVVDGKESKTPAGTAKPGDVIEYQASYRNQSAKELRNVQPTLPIPEGSQFITDALKPAPVAASINGRDFDTFPLKRTITLPDGTKHVVDVPLAEYRALRWTIGTLAPKATSSVAARVRIVTSTPYTAAK